MIELLDIVLPLVLAVCICALYSRWKEKSPFSLKKLLLGYSLRLGVSLLNIMLSVFIFVGFFNVTELEMMFIVAMVFGLSYSAMSYFFPLSDKD